MAEILEITKSEYIDILRNRGKHVTSKIMMTHYLKKLNIKKKKRDLIHLATIRGVVFYVSSVDNILDALFKDIHKKKQTKLNVD